MASKIGSILGLADTEDVSIGESGEKLITLTEWFGEIADALEKNPTLELLGAVGEDAVNWSKTLQVISKLAKKVITERSPQVLGWVACTLAYREAALEVVRVDAPRPQSRLPFSAQIVHRELAKLRLDDPRIVAGFSLENASGHPFLRRSNQALLAILSGAGYNLEERRKILRVLRAGFTERLAAVLTGDDREKFAPFAEFLRLVTDDSRLYGALVAHAERQRVELEEQPALQIEPFPLESVYIPPDCGVHTWDKTRRNSPSPGLNVRQIDIFEENSAPRLDMMQEVLRLINDPKFHEAIVIVGPPGAGKSTFTKKLSVRLHEEGLLPIRVPLQHLRAERNLFDAIQDFLNRFAGSFKADTLREKVYSETTPVEGGEICPYIFIFDGWDEINLAADEGFQQRVDRLFDLIRQALLDQTRCIIRVIITGRPTRAIERSGFMRDQSRVIAIKATSPQNLREYVHKLDLALKNPTFTDEKIVRWNLGDIARYEGVLNKYTREFSKTSTLEVLGQPLLAHLAMKVLASFEGNPIDLIVKPTTLYRHLTDLTCFRGGKFYTEQSGEGHTVRMEGQQLRDGLQGTALAITAYGLESIPEEELKNRLETLKVGNLTRLKANEDPLASLMIGFFFKEGGDYSTWEFLHKSFREYLAAEAVVQVLKQYGVSILPELKEKSIDDYWCDFPPEDPRFGLTRKLGEIFCGQWLSDEILSHINALLRWEIEISFGTHREEPELNSPGPAKLVLVRRQWEIVRDSLADIWDWWAEGVHLRPQPRLEENIWKTDVAPFVNLLQKRAMRRMNHNQPTPPRPLRTATVDAHLGYAFFQLCTLLHGRICEVMGWMKVARQDGPEKLWNSKADRPRRYQVCIRHGEIDFVQFAPSGESNLYFRNYVLRIVGAGVSPSQSVDFPGKSYMVGVFLAKADLRALDFDEADMATCNLEGASMYQTSARGANLRYVLLNRAELDLADLDGSSMAGADVSEAIFWATTVKGVKLQEVVNLTQKQLNQMAAGMRGGIPQGLKAPEHWE
jgi:hypothetical protein